MINLKTCREWMQTFSKQPFVYWDNNNEYSAIRIQDICTHLARKFRGCGAFHPAVTVAEHSVAVSYIMESVGGDKRAQLYALLHDAHEAYSGDMPAPMKTFLRTHYGFAMELVEKEIQTRIHKALGLSEPDDKLQVLIKMCDSYALRTERKLFAQSKLPWPIDDLQCPEDYSYLYAALSVSDSARDFKERYQWLTDKSVV